MTAAGQTPRSTAEFLVEMGSFAFGTLNVATNDADTGVGVIAIDDTDIGAGVLAEGDWTATFSGPYDNQSGALVSATVTRGRDALLEEMVAGTMTAIIRDASGLFNHANPASPLYGQIDDRMHPVKLRLTNSAGVMQGVYYGLTRQIRWQRSGRKGTATFDCVDLFYWLQRAKPVIASTGPTTTGAAIGLILDSIRWLDPAARTLAVGDSIPDFSADGSKTALDLIGGLLEAERGVFYIDVDGRAVYEDRYARLLRASETSIVDVMTDLQPEVDFDLIQNRVTVSMLDATGDVVYSAVATDDVSVAKIGYSDADEIQTTYLASTSQADGLAAWILPIVSSPSSPVRDFTVDARDDHLLDSILGLDLVDRLTLSAAAGGTAGDFIVEQLVVTAQNGGRVSANYVLSAATDEEILLVAIDDTDVLVGTIATDDADVTAGIGEIVY